MHTHTPTQFSHEAQLHEDCFVQRVVYGMCGCMMYVGALILRRKDTSLCSAYTTHYVIPPRHIHSIHVCGIIGPIVPAKLLPCPLTF